MDKTNPKRCELKIDRTSNISSSIPANMITSQSTQTSIRDNQIQHIESMNSCAHLLSAGSLFKHTLRRNLNVIRINLAPTDPVHRQAFYRLFETHFGFLLRILDWSNSTDKDTEKVVKVYEKNDPQCFIEELADLSLEYPGWQFMEDCDDIEYALRNSIYYKDVQEKVRMSDHSSFDVDVSNALVVLRALLTPRDPINMVEFMHIWEPIESLSKSRDSTANLEWIKGIEVALEEVTQCLCEKFRSGWKASWQELPLATKPDRYMPPVKRHRQFMDDRVAFRVFGEETETF